MWTVGKRYSLIFTVLLLASLILMELPVWAEGASHTISVTIQEISRFRIEWIRPLEPAGENPVYEVGLAVFNNSTRQWNLTVQTEGYPEKLEWSTDSQHWQELSSGVNTLVSGNKSIWTRYRIYYRFHQPFKGTADPGNLQYQLCYQQ